MEQDESLYSGDVGLFSTVRVLLFSDRSTDLIEQFHRWNILSVFLDFNISSVFS